MRSKEDAALFRTFSRQLDRDFALNITEIQKKFSAVNTSDPASLRDWLVDYDYLINTDHARVANVCLRTIRRWKQAAGQKPAKRQPPYGGHRYWHPLVAPSDWKAGTWLEDQYGWRFSIRQIARAIGRSYTFTRRLLRRRGIVLRTLRQAVAPMHYCCTRRWLLDHYVEQRLSLTRCALLARVSKSTMTGWLLRYQIRTRGVAEQLALDYLAKSRQGAR